MYLARDSGGMRVPASPKGKASCPCCGEPVVPRCGEVRIWHWAHSAKEDCDPWYEHETAWHRTWKDFCDEDRIEVTIGPHRADIVGKEGIVIELQHSMISPAEVREREAFYGNMVWLIDGTPFKDQIRVEITEKGPIFSWSPPRPTWFYARKYRFIHGFSVGSHIHGVNRFNGKVEARWRASHYSNEILQILTMKTRGKVTGSGRILSVDQFVQRLF